MTFLFCTEILEALKFLFGNFLNFFYLAWNSTLLWYVLLPNYKSIHQVRNYSKGGEVSIYINISLNFKVRPDLSTNSRDENHFQ